MVGPFALDGYDVLAPLDAAGRSWRAVCVADGHRVVLRRWVGAAARLAEVRRRAAQWGSLPDGGVVAVRDVVALGDDLVVVTDLAPGGGLAPLVARRGQLTPGQIVTLVAPIAQTLVATHDRGLVHGRISMSNVVLDQDGRPMLTDWLLAGVGDPSGDVAALVAVARQCIGDDASETLLSLLRSTLDARTLADELLAAFRAEPLLALPTVVDPAPPARASRRSASGLFGVTAAAIAVAIGFGIVWGQHDSVAGGAVVLPSPTTTPATVAGNVDWLKVVHALESQRVRAFTELSETALAKIELRGTSLWRSDVRMMARLRSADVRFRGLHVRVTSAQPQSISRRRMVLRVVDSLASGPIRMVLKRRDDRWLIARVTRRSR